jgi:ATP-dependent Clp protease ATP-binding subunit ClpA
LNTSLTDSFPLERYGYNLTHVARQEVFCPLRGYERCVTRVFEILLRREEPWFAGEAWPSLEKWSAPPGVMRSRFRAFFLAVRQSEGEVMVFVNDFHRLVGGEWQRYPVDEAPLLKPLLARQEIQLIGACTPAQYQQWIFRDPAISCRMQICDVKPDEELQNHDDPQHV